jgi:hypothetical protein
MSCARSFIVLIAKPEASNTLAAASVLSLLRIATALTNEPDLRAASKAIDSGGRQWPVGSRTGGAVSLIASSALAPNKSSCIHRSDCLMFKKE